MSRNVVSSSILVLFLISGFPVGRPLAGQAAGRREGAGLGGSGSRPGGKGMAGEAVPPGGGEGIVIRVRETKGPVVIDGRLDDPAWRDAIPHCDYFFQQEPLDRAPSSEKIKVLVLQDEENLYFGIQCYDSEPEKVFASVKRRDGSFLNDDALELLIDTFRDERNCYAFGTNPFGVKVDAIISDEGNHINKSWDCIWFCKALMHGEGWAVEMAIPFKSLKYKGGSKVD